MTPHPLMLRVSSLWLQAALCSNQYLSCKSCSEFDTLFLFSLIFFLLSIPYYRKLSLPPMLCPCGWVGLISIPALPKMGPRRTCNGSLRPAPLGHSGWLRDVHMTQANSDPGFCQSYPKQGDEDLLGSCRPAARGVPFYYRSCLWGGGSLLRGKQIWIIKVVWRPLIIFLYCVHQCSVVSYSLRRHGL